MKSKVERIGITVIVGLFILIVLVAIPDRDQGTDYGSEYRRLQNPSVNPSYDSSVNPTYGITNPQPQPVSDRSEILKSKVKGYRESTYWGAEHPIDEQVRHMSDDEFERYINEEVIPEDNDVYWGAEY